jgi:hypothetical protein
MTLFSAASAVSAVAGTKPSSMQKTSSKDNSVRVILFMFTNISPGKNF